MLIRFVRMSNGTIKSVEDVPVQAMLIKMKKGASDDDKDDLISQLEQLSQMNSMDVCYYYNIFIIIIIRVLIFM